MISCMHPLIRRKFPAIILILLAGIIAYAGSLHVPFVLDDKTSIIENEVVKKLANYFPAGEGYDFLPNRWVAYLTFALNYHFGGLDVTGYHAVNLLIHLLTALLVYALLLLTFRTPYFKTGSGDETGSGSGKSLTLTSSSASFFIPLLAALLFVVHPVQTQAVTYVVQRVSSLATMFYLLSVLLYVLARLHMEGPGKRNKESAQHQPVPPFGIILLFAGSILSSVLAMKTKEIAFTLPFAVLLYEVFFFRGSWNRRLLCLLPLLATLPIIPLTILTAQGEGLAEIGEQTRVQTGMGRLDYLFTQFRVVATYLRLLVFPVNQNLDYDYPTYTTFFTPPVFLSFLMLAALLALAVYLLWRTSKTRVVQVEEQSDSRKSRIGSTCGQSEPLHHSQPGLSESQPDFSSTCLSRLTSFGLLWFFLTLAVESSIIPIVDVIAEHRLYLPSFGAFTALATSFYLLAAKFKPKIGGRLLFLVPALLVLGFGLATFQRNHIWSDKIRLWQDVVAKSPSKARPHNNLGVALEEAGRRAEAFEILSRAISLDPNFSRSYYNLADLYLVNDQPREALPLLQTAIRLRPDFTEAYVGMGAALMRAGQFREAAIFLEQNIERIGGNAEARFYLGSSYSFLGMRDAALRQLQIVSGLDPELAASLAGLLRVNSSHGTASGR